MKQNIGRNHDLYLQQEPGGPGGEADKGQKTKNRFRAF